MLYKDSYWYEKKEDHKENGCVEINIWCAGKESHKVDDKPYPRPEYEKEPYQKEGYDKKCDKNDCRCVVINIFCEEKEEKGKDPRPQQA